MIDVKGDINATEISDSSMVFHVTYGKMDVNANSIIISGAGNAVFTQMGGELTINTEKDIYLKSKSTTVGAAILNNSDIDKESIININSKNGSITIISDEGTAVSAYGSDWQTSNAVSNSNKVILSAAGDVIIQGKTAIKANNGINENKCAKVQVAGTNITVKGDIIADNYGNVSIGENEGFVKADITGDIEANGNSNVYISLGSGNLEGAIKSDDTSDVSLDMEDAVWNVTGNSEVDEITGEGLIALNVDDLDKIDEVNISDAKNADLTVAAQQNADDIADANAALNAMADAVEGVSDGTVIKVREGILNGETSGILEHDGNDHSVTNIHHNDSTSTMGNMRTWQAWLLLHGVRKTAP